ncbi:MAG: peptidase M48 [Desulfobulbaceae bacterium]|nr:MAG: peptidase M48 [Desulfobulbaceae bacterium]
MSYNSLIYLLLAVLILITREVPAEPQFSGLVTLFLFGLKSAIFIAISHHYFRRPGPRSVAVYFKLEHRLAILALISLAADVYLLDITYYFAKLGATDFLPSLISHAGLALFLGYRLLAWGRARPSYCRIFAADHRLWPFLAANIKLNLVIMLPWLLLTLLIDLLALAPFATMQKILAAPWGELLIILAFFLPLLLIFPWLATRLWNCRPLPAGPLRRRLENLCRAHRVQFRDIVLWPLFEGRPLTAGVMGLTRHFRYILITPAMIQTVSSEELEAVVAHEIGHVRQHHLFFYLLFLLSFALLVHLVSFPLLWLLLDSSLLGWLMALTDKSPKAIIGLAMTMILLLLLMVYFRLLLGFFMRNFERQADLYALEAMGRAEPLIGVFEKIARAGGKIRNLPSWHHFSIGQRIDYLTASEENPRLIGRHHRKVRLALIIFLTLLGSSALLLHQLSADSSEEKFQARLIEVFIQDKVRRTLDSAKPRERKYLEE